MKKIMSALVFVVVFAIPFTAQASVLIKGSKALGFYEFSYSGQLDLTGMALIGQVSGPGQSVFPAAGEFQSFVGVLDVYGPAIFGGSFGSGGPSDSFSGTTFGGDFAVFLGGTIGVPSGYQSNDPISGQILFCCGVGTQNLGLSPGNHLVALLPSGDEIRLIAPVPLPATLPVLLGAFGAIGLLRRRAA